MRHFGWWRALIKCYRVEDGLVATAVCLCTCGVCSVRRFARPRGSVARCVSRRRQLRGPLIVAQEVSSANPQFRHLNVRHFLATFGGFCPTFLPTFWPFGPQICPKSAIDLQKFDFRPDFFMIFASDSVYGPEVALLRRGFEPAVTFILVDA